MTSIEAHRKWEMGGLTLCSHEAFVRSSAQGIAAKLGGEASASGSALQQKILEELKAPVDTARRWFELGACFAKGTLVHTKVGLVPIEQIKVGDWVLSKPENGGEQAYKRVLQTFAHKPERIVNLQYVLPGQDSTHGQPIHLRRISVTRNHPFWTKERGWTAVSELRSYSLSSVYPLAFTLEDKFGQPIEFFECMNVYVSDQPTIGWSPNHMGAWDSHGALWDYETHKLIAESVMPLESLEETYRDLCDPESIDPAFFFAAPVYNLEVEDFHTYYVGEHGIWVHNQNCGGLHECRKAEEMLNIIKAGGLDSRLQIHKAGQDANGDSIRAL